MKENQPSSILPLTPFQPDISYTDNQCPAHAHTHDLCLFFPIIPLTHDFFCFGFTVQAIDI